MWRYPYQVWGNWPRSSLTMRSFEEINIDTSYFHVCKYTKTSQWSVQRSSLGQATNKRLTDHSVNNNIFYETFSNSPVDNVLGEVFHVQKVQKDVKYVRKLMFLLWLWLCHMIRWIIAANVMYSFFNCWQTHMWSGVFSRSLTREKTLRIWMLLCHLQSGENTKIPWY